MSQSQVLNFENAWGGAAAGRELNWLGVKAGGYELASRAFQTLLCAIGLLVLSPVMAVIALAIKIVSPGPVFYRGERVGKYLRPFTIYKFRTLETDAESKIGGRLLTPDDPLYHPLGKLLKKTKLDELPQLLNVIRGDMRLVGPRPVRPVFLKECKALAGFEQRFSVCPGMTGLAQVRGGYFTSFANKFRYDLLYVRRRSLRLDLTIMLMTFIKLAQRWLTTASLLLLLLLFVSLMPASLLQSFSVEMMGIRFNPVIPCILAAGGWLVLHAGSSNRWLISHSAVDWPMLSWMIAALAAVPFSISPSTAFRGVVYMCVTGFMMIFVMVNLRPDEHFARRAVQLLALLAGVVSLVGLADFAISGMSGASVSSHRDADGFLSALGTAPALAAYLVFCFPLVLGEYFISRLSRNGLRSRRTLLWAALAMLMLCTVFAAGNAFTWAALAAGVSFLLVKMRKINLRSLPVALSVLIILLEAGSILTGKPGPSDTVLELVRGGRLAVESVQRLPAQQLMIGHGSRTILTNAALADSPFGGVTPRSTYLTLLFENGLAGLLLMFWLVIGAAGETSSAAGWQRSEALRIRLWSFIAAILAMAVAACSCNIFTSLPIQITFWGVIGLALGLCMRYGGRDHGAMLLVRFGSDEMK